MNRPWDSASQPEKPGGDKAARSLCASRNLARMAGVALLAGQLCRAMAQEENQAAFRQEYYIEENDRVKINTQSVLFDSELTRNVRLNGTLTFDAVSGASPIGAPPPDKWQYPTYTDYYNSYYNQAYASRFDQEVIANQVLVDAGIVTYQQMTNDAAAAAAAAAPGIATVNADASYQSLTNHPNYKSDKVPLAKLTDNRVAFSLAPSFTFGRHLITPSFAYSEESDYVSYVGALNYSLALNQKNTTLNFGWSHNADSVWDNRSAWRDKTVDSFLIGGVQLLSPKSYVTFNFTYGNEDGFLSDPYKGVMFTITDTSNLVGVILHDLDDPSYDGENRPRHRDRQIFHLSYTQFFDPLNGSLDCSYRFARDSWEVLAHTLDLRWHQKLGRQLVISPLFRYHEQSAAEFYYPGLVPGGTDRPEFYSSDYRLSHLQTFTYGVHLTWRMDKHVSVDLGYQRYVMEGLDRTSPSAYPEANVYSIGARLRF
jgi:hypothetical protein